MEQLPKRYKWPDIARDLVQLTLPQTSPSMVSPREIAEFHELTEEEFVSLTRNPVFKQLFKSERAKAESLGERAGHIYRTEEMAADIAELLYMRLKSPATKVEDLIKGYQVLAKSAGVDMPAERVGSNGGGQQAVMVQINLPQLDNPKLDHLKVTNV